MKGQLQRLGISYAWERELATCQPEYYRWNQWLFLQMLRRDLAYRKRSTVNWCASCQTVLANEQVVDGGCWRCGTPVSSRTLEQWFLRITRYAQELLEAIDHLTAWPEKVLTMQRNWIGRSEGVRIAFPLLEQGRAGGPAVQAAETVGIDVFTTRIDTIFGATFVLLAPEHELVERLATESGDPRSFREQVDRFRRQDRAARLSGQVEKEGFFTGRQALNPFSGEPVPVWVANFVLGEYGTGAVMGVPAHDQRDFEFARKYRSADPRRHPARRGRDGAVRRHDGGGICRSRRRGRLGRVLRAGVAGRDPAHGRSGRTARDCRAHGAVPAEGLGHLAAAVLGHADPGGLLRQVRDRAGARRSASGPAPTL